MVYRIVSTSQTVGTAISEMGITIGSIIRNETLKYIEDDSVSTLTRVFI